MDVARVLAEVVAAQVEHPGARALPSRLAEQKPSTASGKMLKTSTLMIVLDPACGSLIARLVVLEEALRRVDRDQVVLVTHDERHRHERAALELEQVVRRVGDYRDAATAGFPVTSTTLDPISSCTQRASGSSIGSA